MNARQIFIQFVEKKGLRHTQQREQILEIVLKSERHLSTQDLYDLMRKKYPYIGYATVARTLKLLDESGVCRRVDLGDNIVRYEHQFGHDHHDHLICLQCGSFVEIASEALEKLQNKLVKKHGYIQKNHKLDIFGICPKCQKKGRKTK